MWIDWRDVFHLAQEFKQVHCSELMTSRRVVVWDCHFFFFHLQKKFMKNSGEIISNSWMEWCKHIFNPVRSCRIRECGWGEWRWTNSIHIGSDRLVAGDAGRTERETLLSSLRKMCENHRLDSSMFIFSDEIEELHFSPPVCGTHPDRDSKGTDPVIGVQIPAATGAHRFWAPLRTSHRCLCHLCTLSAVRTSL